MYLIKDNIYELHTHLLNLFRPNLPYTEAVIMESQRCGNIVPMGVIHFNTVSIEVRYVNKEENDFHRFASEREIKRQKAFHKKYDRKV